jgi:hypothetical protein
MWASWHAGRGPVKHLAAANPSHRARARGVILSVDKYTLVFGGTFPVGAFLVGAISERWGVGAAMLAAGGSGLATLLGIGLWWTERRKRRDARPAAP